MRIGPRLTPLLAIVLLSCLVGTACAQETIDDIKRQLKIAADKMEADVRDLLVEAEKLAKKNLREAVKTLEFLQVKLELDRALTPERRKELQNLVATRIRHYQQARAMGEAEEWEERIRKNQGLQRSHEQKQNEMRQMAGQIAELYKQGKFIEALQLSQQRDKKFGTSPQQEEEKLRVIEQVRKLLEQGRLTEALELNSRWVEQYGRPFLTLSDRRRRIQDALRSIRELKEVGGARSLEKSPAEHPFWNALDDLRRFDEGDYRFRKALAQVIHAALPTLDDSEKQVPENWRMLLERHRLIRLTADEEKLLAALKTLVTVDLKEQPLDRVLAGFEKRHSLSCTLDTQALEQLKIKADVPVSLRAKNVTLGTILKRVLGDVGLTPVISKGELLITSPARARAMMVTRTYYVRNLAEPLQHPFDPGGLTPTEAVQSIAELIRKIEKIEPQAWESGGGQGTIRFDSQRMVIVVKQQPEIHFRLQGKLP